MLALILTVIAVLAVFYAVFFVFFPLGRGAVYVPSSPENTRRMVDAASPAPGERAVDLGAGDGRLVAALAACGVEAHGYEINPILVLLARRNIRRAGLAGRAFIHWKSFWRARLSGFQVVVVFQGSFIMRRLERKLRRELAPGARVVTDYWRLPGLVPELTRGTVYRYTMP